MDFLKKESASETTQSFTQRVPLGEKQSQNTSYVSQIQELMALLVQKKAQIKQAKLKQANLLGKQEQQHVRIGKIKVGMEHQIEKEQVLRTQQDRLQQQICVCKQSIKQLTKCVKTIKGQLSDLLENIISSKKNKADLETVCGEIQCLITGKTTENAKIDEQIQNLETLILSCQNDVRSKQDQLTNLQIEKTELCTLLDFLEQKMKMATRAKNSCQVQNNQICQQILKSEQKIQNIKKQANEIEWSCEQIRSQNSQIEDLNRRLLTDLEGVRKHLAMMEKMNQLLQNSLTEFDMTGDKVTRLITAAKSY